MINEIEKVYVKCKECFYKKTCERKIIFYLSEGKVQEFRAAGCCYGKKSEDKTIP